MDDPFGDFDLDLPGFSNAPKQTIDKEFEGLLGNLPSNSGFVAQSDMDMEAQVRADIARMQAEEEEEERKKQQEVEKPAVIANPSPVEVVKKRTQERAKTVNVPKAPISDDSDSDLDDLVGDLYKKFDEKEEVDKPQEPEPQRLNTPNQIPVANPVQADLPPRNIQTASPAFPVQDSRQPPRPVTNDPMRLSGNMGGMPDPGQRMHQGLPPANVNIPRMAQTPPTKLPAPLVAPNSAGPMSRSIERIGTAPLGMDSIGTLPIKGSRRGRNAPPIDQQRPASAGPARDASPNEGFSLLRGPKETDPPPNRKSDEIKEIKSGQINTRLEFEQEPLTQQTQVPISQPITQASPMQVPMQQSIAQPIQQPIAQPQFMTPQMASPMVPSMVQPISQTIAQPMMQPMAQVDHTETNALRTRVTMLEDELKMSVESKDKAVSDERDRLRKTHEKELSDREKEHQAELKKTRNEYEKKLVEFEAMKAHADSIASIADTVNENKNQLLDLSTQLERKKAMEDQLREEQLISRQRILTQLEGKLQLESKMLEGDKDQLNTLMRQLKDNEEIRRSAFEADQDRLKQERAQIQEFHDFVKNQDRQRKEEILIEKQRLELLKETFDASKKVAAEEIEDAKSSLSLREKLVEDNKREIMSMAEQQRLDYSAKNNALEGVRRKLGNLEVEITRKYNTADERERTIRTEWDTLQRAKEQFALENRKIEEEAMKVHTLGTKIQEESEVIAQARVELEHEREEISRARYELVSKESAAKKEIQRSEIMRRDLSVQLQTFEKARSGYVSDAAMRPQTSGPSRMFGTPSHDHELSQEVRSKQPSQKRSRFNANEFLEELEGYEKSRSDLQNFIVSESENLMSSRMEMDKEFSESIASSTQRDREDSMN